MKTKIGIIGWTPGQTNPIGVIHYTDNELKIRIDTEF